MKRTVDRLTMLCLEKSAPTIVLFDLLLASCRHLKGVPGKGGTLKERVLDRFTAV
jgi:hypothetical protein